MSHPPLIIRTYQPTDEADVVALWERTGITRPWNDPRKDIARKLRASADLFLVGLVDHRLVASVMVGYDGHRGWINYLAVDPDCQRRGYGRALMLAAEDRLLAAGCPKINLQVRTGNTEVISFYRQIGFEIDDVVSLGKRLEHDGPRPG